MSKPSPDEVAHMVEMARWLQEAVRTEGVTGLSIALIDESDGLPVPRHVFFALPGSIAALAGAYVLASHDLAVRMTLPPGLGVPPPSAGVDPGTPNAHGLGPDTDGGPNPDFVVEDLPPLPPRQGVHDPRELTPHFTDDDEPKKH